MIKIGDLQLGLHPRVVAIIDNFFDIQEIVNLKNLGVSILEMRVDCFDAQLEDVVGYIKKVKDSTSLPAIGTVRETDKNRSIRTEYFREILPYVDCVDIELGTPISDTIISYCKNQVIMVSEHDFTRTPQEDELQLMVEKAIDQGAQIVKIATMANSVADVRRLLNFTEKCETPIVTIAMGPIGKISRVIAPLYGSLFSYGFIKGEVAPGQLPVTRLIEEFKLYYPDF